MGNLRMADLQVVCEVRLRFFRLHFLVVRRFLQLEVALGLRNVDVVRVASRHALLLRHSFLTKYRRVGTKVVLWYHMFKLIKCVRVGTNSDRGVASRFSFANSCVTFHLGSSSHAQRLEVTLKIYTT